MTKVEFIRAWHDTIEKETGMVFTNKNATIMYETFVAQLVAEIRKHSKANLCGLGIFKIKKRPARKGRNPKTGDTIEIPARKTIAFRVADQLKQSLN